VEEGALVSIGDVAEEAGARAAGELGPRAYFRRVDVTDKAAVDAWVADAHARLGRIDILVNNAGIIRDHQLVRVKDGEIVGRMAEADFDLVVAVNLKGTFLCTQAVAPIMIRQRSGVILNASSVAGLDGNFGQTNYVATKAGIVGMTKVWARELGRYGIRVNGDRDPQDDAGEGPGEYPLPHALGAAGGPPGHRERLPLPGLGRGRVHHWGRAPRGRGARSRDLRGGDPWTQVTSCSAEPS